MAKLNPYQKYFQGKLKKFGVTSPSQLPADKRKFFWSEVKRDWSSKKATKESNKRIGALKRHHMKKRNMDEMSLGSILDEMK